MTDLTNSIIFYISNLNSVHNIVTKEEISVKKTGQGVTTIITDSNSRRVVVNLNFRPIVEVNEEDFVSVFFCCDSKWTYKSRKGP